ncbi:MAG TPA: MarR family transcriptional regulator [Candidatus Mediterraneibacter caccavium]|uniref:MarR family transcriptional regulator n=1 Tax=Candidatus Mediterraneibacter caccavium TaxID=2838661 RepID=A0A9D1VXE0_9FIRM|nr:MarR family transcriptional regulator [Candidatus Mediterraneibacter caccavium]
MSHSFHYLIMAEHSIFQKELLNRLKNTGLTIGQPKVLDYLKDHDGAGQKDIARGCHIEPGTLTTILNRMEDAGLVERRMLNGNRRSLYVFLTEKGKEQLKLVTEAFSWMEKEAFRGISETERKTFMDLMLRVYENISSRKD